jgi:PAS domain S-box-containing protein
VRGGSQIVDRPRRVVRAITWLRARQRLSLVSALVGMAAILIVDLIVPSYAVTAAYLVVLTFAAIALPQRIALAIGATGLALTLIVMVDQNGVNVDNLLLVWFGVLAGAGVFALVSLYDSAEALFRTQEERLDRGAFLVDLVDALLPLSEPLDAEEATVRLLGERLEAARTAFYEADDAGRLVVRCAHERRAASAALDLDSFAGDLAAAGGRALVLPAPEPRDEPAGRQRSALDAAGLRHCLAAPILEEGELVAAVAVCDASVREWAQSDAELLEESVARAWTEVRRARSDAALRETESQLRDTLDSSVDGIYRLNVRTGRFDYISPSAATITGVPIAELRKTGGPLARANIHPDDLAAAARAAADLERDGVAELECRWAAHGAYRWYSGVMRLTRDEHGDPLYRMGTFRDVTEQKRRELNRALLADLQDRLAQITSARDVLDATGSRLGAHLGVRSVCLTEIEPGNLDGAVHVVWTDGEAPPPSSRGRLTEYVSDEVMTALRQGAAVACRDTETDARADAEACRAIDTRAWVMVPFRRGGDLRFTLCVTTSEARDWRDDEVELLRDVAVRVLPRLERARAEEALRASEARFRLIVTTANDGIAMTDPSGVVTYVNDRLAELLGFDRDELIGRSVLDLLASDDPAEDAPAETWPLAGARNDFRFTRSDGSQIWFLVTNAPLRDDEGRYTGNLAMFTDITARKATESAVARQARLLDSVHDAILALDDEFKVTYWNDRAEELFGWTRDEAIGRSSKDLLQGVFPGSSWDAALETLLREGSFRGEVQYRHKDGHGVWVDAHSRVTRSVRGDIDGVVTSFRDIREQKYAQQALTWEAARLRAIVEAAPVGLGIVAADGEVLLRNDVLRAIWMGEAPVASVDEFEAYKAYWPETGKRLDPEDWPAAQALKTGRMFADVVVDIDRFDGTRGTIVLSTAPIEDEGAIMGAVTIVQDITRMREAEQALRFLTDEVRALHEAVLLDRTLSSTELASYVVEQAGKLLGTDGGSIFLLGDGGSVRRVAGVGVPDPDGVDDLVAQVIGDKAAAVRPLPPAREAAASRGTVVLAVPLVVRSEAQPFDVSGGTHHYAETVFGALALTFVNRRSVDEDQVRIARAFADQAALAIENARLRARIEEAAVEAERTRLARDLHDSVTQSLFAASLKAEALADMLDDPQKALTAVEELRRLARGSLAGMRTMLLEMRGDALQQTPLPELLRHLVEASGSRIGADIRLAVQGRRPPLPPDVQTALYRIAQEALNNVARHAKASEARVELRLDDDGVRLEIGDDGRGFDSGTESAGGHFGLHNMRERAQAIGARFAITTGPGRGTVVTVEWPLKEGEDHE